MFTVQLPRWRILYISLQLLCCSYHVGGMTVRQKPGALHNLSEFVSGRHRFGCQEYLTAVAVRKEEKSHLRESILQRGFWLPWWEGEPGILPCSGNSTPPPPQVQYQSTASYQRCHGPHVILFGLKTADPCKVGMTFASANLITANTLLLAGIFYIVGNKK